MTYCPIPAHITRWQTTQHSRTLVAWHTPIPAHTSITRIAANCCKTSGTISTTSFTYKPPRPPQPPQSFCICSEFYRVIHFLREFLLLSGVRCPYMVPWVVNYQELIQRYIWRGSVGGVWCWGAILGPLYGALYTSTVINKVRMCPRWSLPLYSHYSLTRGVPPWILLRYSIPSYSKT